MAKSAKQLRQNTTNIVQTVAEVQELEKKNNALLNEKAALEQEHANLKNALASADEKLKTVSANTETEVVKNLKILHNKADKIGGGKNGNAVSEEMMDQLHRFASYGVPTEYGYPCGHRRLLKYCTDPAVTSWEKLYDLHFLKFEESSNSKDGQNFVLQLHECLSS